MVKAQLVNGKLLLEDKSIAFNRLLKREVFKNNPTSGKITMPKKSIGKKVMVIWSD